MSMRKWRVRWLGDPEYGGLDSWENSALGIDETIVDAIDAGSAAHKAMISWRKEDAFYVNEEGWYNDGTVVGVQEVVEPPPVKKFIQKNGRMRYMLGNRVQK